MSKRSDAIEVMKANEGKPMADVVKLIAAQIDVTEANAKSYYKWIMANVFGQAVAKAPRAAKTTEIDRKTKTAKPKLIKVPKPRVAGDKEQAAKAKLGQTKTAEEIADIRAKNLQRLKSVHAKYAKGQYAEPTAPGVKDFDPDEARAYVEAVTNDLDSFKAPSFLDMDQVKALV